MLLNIIGVCENVTPLHLAVHDLEDDYHAPVDIGIMGGDGTRALQWGSCTYRGSYLRNLKVVCMPRICYRVFRDMV